MYHHHDEVTPQEAPMKHTRRLISLLLVLALALAISPSAFAAGEDGGDTPPAETEPQAIVIPAELTNGILSFSDIKSKLSGLVTNGNASHVSNLSVAPAQGTLYLGYISEANPGAGVASTQNLYFNSTGYESVDNVTFVPNPNYIGEAEITFSVFSSSGGSPTSGTINVKVEHQEVALSYSSNGDPIRFQAEDFSAWCLSVTGRSISSVTFTLPSERYGTMYYNYVDENIFDGLVDTGTQYFRVGLPSINNITLIPAENYSGTFYVSFSGLDTAGVPVRGQVRISISGSGGNNPSSGSDLTYSVTAGQSVYFRAEDFSKVCKSQTGSELDYVYFDRLPNSRYGTLYYGNNIVKTTTPYSYSMLGSIRFLADSGYEGTVTIPFTGYSKNTEKTSFSGVITIDVSEGGAANFSYTVRAGRRVYIRVADIAEACYEQTGYQLSHVRFTSLPTSTQGSLCYNAAKVTTTNRSYYVSANDYLLENVNFLADDNYEGTFNILFTAYSSYEGKTFDGALRMEVTDAGSSAIIYIVRAGQRIGLNADNFADTCSRKTGYPLNYVRFSSLPTSTYGIFYENDATAVSSGTSYYRSGNTHLLENISFVADANYSGTFSVGYTCYSSGGGSFAGTFTVIVMAASASQAPTITYYSTGPAAKFSASDFSSAALQSLSDSLAGVRFTAPDTSVGKMYYAYTSPASHSTFVSGQSYSAALLSQISFLPRAGYSGTVSIPYTATDNSGNTASGTVQVIVTPPLTSSYFTDMKSSSWAVPAVDFLRTYQVVNGVNATEYSPSASMRRGDFILMLSRAYGFSSTGTVSFSDVPQNSYYASAIAAARSRGIVEGDSSGLFHPNDPISRQDAAVILYRCMRQNGQNLTGTESALFRFSDSGSIASYAIEAMAALVHFGVFQGDANGRLKPTALLTRAEMASILYRAVTY